MRQQLSFCRYRLAACPGRSMGAFGPTLHFIYRKRKETTTEFLLEPGLGLCLQTKGRIQTYSHRGMTFPFFFMGKEMRQQLSFCRYRLAACPGREMGAFGATLHLIYGKGNETATEFLSVPGCALSWQSNGRIRSYPPFN